MCEWVGDVGGSGAILYGFILYRFCEQRSTTLGYTPPHSRAVSTYINPYITPLPRSASLLGIDGVHEQVLEKGVYGERSRRTRLLRDQLWRADAGSWQIADGGATRKAAAGGTSVGDLRVHFVVEL